MVWGNDGFFMRFNANRSLKVGTDSSHKTLPECTGAGIWGLFHAEGSRIKKTKHKYAQKEEKALLNRPEKYMDNHLLFIYDFNVGFDNNMSERDLRKVKNCRKIAGGFRKISEQEMPCNILTIIETLKRRNMEILENIKIFFEKTPVLL